MILNGLPERYEYFVVQESFNHAGNFVELRSRLMNYEESRPHREYVDDVDSDVAMTSTKAKSKHKSSVNNNAPPKSSSGQLTCYCCFMKAHMKSECYIREKVECTFCQQKCRIVKTCIEKAPGTEPGSLASILQSDRTSFGATEQDLIVDSGSTDDIVVNKKWLKSLREIDTTVTNPDGGNTKVVGTGEVDVLARYVKGCTKPLILKKALYLPGYRTNILKKGDKVVHEKKQFSSPKKQRKNSNYKKRNFFCP